MPTQGQAGQTAQVTLTKPPVVSVPAVVSAVTTMSGISVAINQAQKTGEFHSVRVFILWEGGHMPVLAHDLIHQAEEGTSCCLVLIDSTVFKGFVF